uniref:Thioredoxin domain-containing protein n=1 Tax=Branchiostoma floridae TaxID=7739 RepID=C3YP37_BRAFL|eukprot:XP_002601916.1 hypothetical protein BRAFLDRAFT_86400 [Branchiostoma floridae]
MAAPMSKKTRQWYGKCLVVLLALCTAEGQVASPGNKQDSAAFYDGMAELLQPEAESAHSSAELDRTSEDSAHSSVELDRTSAPNSALDRTSEDSAQTAVQLDRTSAPRQPDSAQSSVELDETSEDSAQSSVELDRTLSPGDPEPQRAGDSVATETDSGQQESLAAAELDRTDSSSAMESGKPERSGGESDRTKCSVVTEPEREAGLAIEQDRVSQNVESDLASKSSSSESLSVESDRTTASSEGGSDKISESPSLESEATQSVEEPQENPGVDQGNQTLPAPVTPGNATAGNGTGDQPVAEETSAAGSKHAPKKVSCAAREKSDGEPLVVKVVNGSELIRILKVTQNTSGNVTAEGDCVLIMFYAAWCPFSAAAAPPYHALARAFPDVLLLAIDAIANSHLNTRFGTVAVPNIMLFYNGKALSRFNQSERSLEQLRMFVKNHTAGSPHACSTSTCRLRGMYRGGWFNINMQTEGGSTGGCWFNISMQTEGGSFNISMQTEGGVQGGSTGGLLVQHQHAD